MARLEIRLFGMPDVRLDGEEVYFPYAKINAMLYYLAVKTVVSRDEIAGLLWPEEDERIAKKNLRNAIYQAKKSLGAEFIDSPKKSLLGLNWDQDIFCDALEFGENPADHLSLYEGDFLDGFYIKDSEEYEFWTMKMRAFYQEKYIANAYKVLSEAIDKGQYDQVEKPLHTLVNTDEFDERNVRLLMTFYAKTGRKGKVIEAYYNLKKLLRDELGISPDQDTQALYRDAIAMAPEPAKEKAPFFYGRYQELAQLGGAIQALAQGKGSGHAILLEGEAGVGKTALVRRALEEAPEEILTMEVVSYQAETHFSLRPMEVFLRRLEDRLSQLGEEQTLAWKNLVQDARLEGDSQESPSTASGRAVSELARMILLALDEITQQSPLIVIFEDLHWMDDLSVQVLMATLLRANARTLFLLLSRPVFRQDLLDMDSTLTNEGKLSEISLKRFNRKASEEFVREALGKKLTGKVMDRIYWETEGSPFFLTEYLQVFNNPDRDPFMTPKIKDAIRARFAFLSSQERQLIDLVSYFYDEAPLSLLSRLTGLSNLDLIGMLEGLKKTNLLVEKAHQEDVGITFSHIKLREYIYQDQSPAKRQAIHQRIGQLLEEEVEAGGTGYAYSKLVYHFRGAKDLFKSLKYELETLNYYLNFSHELFPVLTYQREDDREGVYIPRDRAQSAFAHLEDQFSRIQGRKEEEIHRLLLLFYYIKGRYLIHDGLYEEGIQDIRRVIDLAGELGDEVSILESYKQVIFYHIQTNQARGMEKYIEGGLAIATALEDKKEEGILLRLQGLYNIMVGDYDSARTYLKASIRCFESQDFLKRRYVVNIAAAHNYLGEILFQEGKYREAVGQYDRAIELSKAEKASSAMSVFYINKGKALYAMDQVDLAGEEFAMAYQLYGLFDSFWKRPVLEAYLALCYFDTGNMEASAKFLARADESRLSLKDPRAAGTVAFVWTQILKNTEEGDLDPSLAALQKEDPEIYRAQALDGLDPNRDAFERGRIEG